MGSFDLIPKLRGLQLTEGNEGNEGGRCLIVEPGPRLFVAFVTFCKPLCLDSKTGDFDSQKETKETKGAADLIPKSGVGKLFVAFVTFCKPLRLDS